MWFNTNFLHVLRFVKLDSRSDFNDLKNLINLKSYSVENCILKQSEKLVKFVFDILEIKYGYRSNIPQVPHYWVQFDFAFDHSTTSHVQ